MQIYQPQEDSELLKKYTKKLAFGKVLDMGAGSGIQTIEASKKKKVVSVLGVDVDERATNILKNKIKRLKNKNIKNKKNTFHKIKIKKSDLFSNIKGCFDTILFNPPYLPQDKRIKDPALYGGKKGSEILERFLDSANGYLDKKGIILIVFSSLTNKKKINEILEKNLLEYKELEKKHLFFEDLFVYKITKSDILKQLNKKKIKNIKYFSRGKRGDIFTDFYRGKKVAIKVKRKESEAVERIKNEIKYLKILNKKDIGPRLLFSGKDYFVYEFVEGDFILDYFKGSLNGEKNKKTKENVLKKIILDILKQCFILDQLNINKEEMHRPIKHIIVNQKGKPVLLDFERCYPTKKPHNVTQFCVFLMNQGLLSKLNKENKENKETISLLKEYKQERTEENFNKIIKLLN